MGLLRYVNDDEPGITRVRRGRGFSYRSPDGRHLTDDRTLERIRGLAVPPAWRDVWICTDEHGHLQATGRDAKGRKQYRYHAQWRATRDRSKFEHLVGFGEALPSVRRTVAADLERPALDRARVLATVVRLLELTAVRVGNDEYARTNGSFGLTTLRRRHTSTHSSEIRLAFPGKSGVQHAVSAEDRRVAKVIRRCQEIPGQRLFQYVDDEGTIQPVHSHDVNEYLREASACDVTAKDFRTWIGTTSAASSLAVLEPPSSTAESHRLVNEVLRSVAAELGNTLAVCRASYVHPGVLDGFADGSLGAAWAATPRAPRGLEPDERRLLQFLSGPKRRSHRASP